MPRPARVIGFLLLTAIAGCARPGSLDTSGPFDIEHAPTEGLRYYVTRDLITIDVKITTFHDIVTSTKNSGCAPLDSIATNWTLTVAAVPDRRQAYRLGLRPSGTVDQTLGVKVSDTGVLTGLNYSGVDQRAAITSTIAKGVAGLLGTVTRGGLAAVRDTSCAHMARAKAPLQSTAHVLRTFDLSELPPSPDGVMQWSDITRTLAAYPREGELFSLAHVFISASEVPVPAGVLDAPAAVGSPIGCTGSDSVCARIYYREPIMRVVRVRVPSQMDERAATYAVNEERLVPLVSSSDPILYLSFGTQTLGAGKITLTFGPHGNVTGVEQTSSAAQLGAAAAASAAADDARDAYLAALKAQVDRLDLELRAAKDDAAIRKAQSSDTIPSP